MIARERWTARALGGDKTDLLSAFAIALLTGSLIHFYIMYYHEAKVQRGANKTTHSVYVLHAVHAMPVTHAAHLWHEAMSCDPRTCPTGPAAGVRARLQQGAARLPLYFYFIHAARIALSSSWGVPLRGPQRIYVIIRHLEARCIHAVAHVRPGMEVWEIAAGCPAHPAHRLH